MRVRWTTPARDDLARIRSHYEKLNPQAAKRIAAAIKGASRHLREHPEAGREARFAGAQEFVVYKTNYILLYDLVGPDVHILAVVDGRMDWQEGEPPPKSALTW